MITPIKTDPGFPVPYGATIRQNGINFSLFSRNAKKVWLQLYEPGSEFPFSEISFHPTINRTGDIWHIQVLGLDTSTQYTYRIDGESDPTGSGHCFNPQQALIDPYTKALSGSEIWHNASSIPAWRCLIVNDNFDWRGDRPLNIPLNETIIYELHVRGYTKHESSFVKHPGTYKGIIEKIPYMQALGITAVELMPVTEFNESENVNVNPDTGQHLHNYWGYSPLAFFAPKASYASDGFNGRQIHEFKTMVRALHKAGIEVILDIVFNHTAEGDHNGPTLSFRGIDNTIYYLLDRDKSYLNFSGCGNTFNCNHPLVRHFIITCLRYWVMEMHVDGFRFDLASILGRDQNGEVLSNPPMVEQIAEDPLLADTKIIAEAWDAAGLYQVGNFSNNTRWAEWNGKFRDDVRAFSYGRDNTIAKLATRIAGSSDLYQTSDRTPCNSINFITSHDGFTLYDLVSYNEKHNSQNGEKNQDGDNNNYSWNSGKEGPSKSNTIITLRIRRIKTMAVILFLSQGTPMLTAGDEFCRTQHGNNNAYCQDNEVSWVDWALLKKNSGMFRFFKMLIALRKTYQIFRRAEFFSNDLDHGAREIIWQSHKKDQEDWSPDCKLLGFFLDGNSKNGNCNFFIALNGYSKQQNIEIPFTTNGGKWQLIIDTSKDSPHDITPPGKGKIFSGKKISVAARGAVVLVATKD